MMTKPVDDRPLPPPDRAELAAAETVLSDVVEELCAAANGLSRPRFSPHPRYSLPSRETLIELVEALRSVLFPGHHGLSDLTGESLTFHVGAVLDRVLRSMQEQIKRGLCFDCPTEPSACPDCDDSRAATLTRAFLARLPEVRRLLATDVVAAYEGDPAATGPDEAVLCYPGVLALTNCRLAHELYLLGVPLVPRMITEHAHSITGIDIHPGATIGEGFFMDHGTGVVIGETSVIGKGVRIYQGVTLGAKSYPLDEEGNPVKGMKRHPVVEDGVIIYSGATILGRVVIGRGSVVGGNVWLTRSVPPGSRVTQARSNRESFRDGAGI